MGTRTVTGTIYHPGTNTPWTRASVHFRLEALFATASITYPGDGTVAITDSAGAFSIVLAVPDSGTARYKCTLPDGASFAFVIAAGAATTLETLINASAAASVAQNVVQTAIDAHELLSDAHSFLRLEDTPNAYTGQGGKNVVVKGDASGLEFVTGGGVTDHGALTGLTDDDHPQYHNDARGDARYWQLSTDLATQAELNAHEADTTNIHGIADTSALVTTSALTELVQDIVGAMAVAGANITVTYNDGAGTLTIAVSGLTSAALSDFTEAVQDVVGALGFGGAGLTATYDDAANTLTLVVNVDDSTIEIASDALRVKDLGISTAKIANDAVTYAKMQNVSATDKLLGRVSSGAGDVEEVTFTDFAQSLLDDTTAAAARTTLGTGITPTVEDFTSSGSSTPPTGAVHARIIAIGAGGGGGSGRRGAAGTARFGGGGGAGANLSIVDYTVAELLALAASLTVAIGAGGTAGAARTSDDTDGAGGGLGGSTTVDAGATRVVAVTGGVGGGGGTAAAGSGGTASNSWYTFAANVGGPSGTGGGGGSPGGQSTQPSSGGGGGGGGIDSSNNQRAGGVGGFGGRDRIGSTALSGTGGAAGGTNGGNASNGPGPAAGSGGGGGGGNASGVGGTGGNGVRGGGAGGGGASVNGSNSGAGGVGGDGFVRIIYW